MCSLIGALFYLFLVVVVVVAAAAAAAAIIVVVVVVDDDAQLRDIRRHANAIAISLRCVTCPDCRVRRG